MKGWGVDVITGFHPEGLRITFLSLGHRTLRGFSLKSGMVKSWLGDPSMGDVNYGPESGYDGEEILFQYIFFFVALLVDSMDFV